MESCSAHPLHSGDAAPRSRGGAGGGATANLLSRSTLRAKWIESPDDHEDYPNVDPPSGVLTLQTVDGPVNVKFPPPAVQASKPGDTVAVAFGLVKPPPARGR